MTRYKKALLVIVTALPLGSALAAMATPASAQDAGPVIAGALGGFAAGAIIGSTIGHDGYYGPPKASGKVNWESLDLYFPISVHTA